jgi:hypothetical protein
MGKTPVQAYGFNSFFKEFYLTEKYILSMMFFAVVILSENSV